MTENETTEVRIAWERCSAARKSWAYRTIDTLKSFGADFDTEYKTWTVPTAALDSWTGEKLCVDVVG